MRCRLRALLKVGIMTCLASPRLASPRLALPLLAAAQPAFPAKAVTIVVGFAPDGPADALAPMPTMPMSRRYSRMASGVA